MKSYGKKEVKHCNICNEDISVNESNIHYLSKLYFLQKGLDSEKYIAFEEYPFMKKWVLDRYNLSVEHVYFLASCTDLGVIAMGRELEKGGEAGEEQYELFQKLLANWRTGGRCDCELGRQDVDMPTQLQAVNLPITIIGKLIPRCFQHIKRSQCHYTKKYIECIADVVLVEKSTGKIIKILEIENKSYLTDKKVKFYQQFFKDKWQTINADELGLDIESYMNFKRG